MEKGLFLMCVLLLSEGVLGTQGPLKIAAFNVEIFGRTKLAKSDVVDILKQVRILHNPSSLHCLSSAPETYPFSWFASIKMPYQPRPPMLIELRASQ